MNISTTNGTMGARTHLRRASLLTVAVLVCGMATGALAADITYKYDELGRLLRVFDPAGADITYTYDAAGNVTDRTVVHDTDLDGDPNASDCAPTDSSVYSGAPEINDGLDNQCPGDAGYGLVDEVERGAFSDKTTMSWIAQAGATTYEVARSDTADFSKNCTQWYEISAQTTLTGTPAVGEAYYYLVRAVQPNVGSWGLGDGGERTVSCALP
jgi:YD repeat-containing protein